MAFLGAREVGPCLVRISRNVSARGLGRRGGGGGGLVHPTHSFSSLSSAKKATADFGILFDIDGVIVRGRKVLPFAPTAFRMLVDEKDQFKIPVVFVTNAGNSLRKKKAEQLSDWLNLEIQEDQVVMAHSPLRLFTSFHDKHVLVSGQGPVREIASTLGFSRVTTMTELRHAFPSLDAVDHRRRSRPYPPCAFENHFPPVEAVVLFGEPVRWETSLQLLIDVLVTNGLPCEAPQSLPLPHLPVLACNMDLQWMAEACMPRYGHGAFLLCLEALYKKVTGRDLTYTALIGKPSEITYRYSEHVLQNEARRIGLEGPIRTLYCIGDNVATDIYGANLYHRYLQNRRTARVSSSVLQGEAAGGAAAGSSSSRSVDRLIVYDDEASPISSSSSGAKTKEFGCAERCYSVLVATGVYSGDQNVGGLDHSPRDFMPTEECYQKPTYSVASVLEAVDLIFRVEGFS